MFEFESLFYCSRNEFDVRYTFEIKTGNQMVIIKIVVSFNMDPMDGTDSRVPMADRMVPTADRKDADPIRRSPIRRTDNAALPVVDR